MDIKQRIDENKKVILHFQKIKKEVDDNIRRWENINKELYRSCTHDFEEVPCMGANIVKCKICGYGDGR